MIDRPRSRIVEIDAILLAVVSPERAHLALGLDFSECLRKRSAYIVPIQGKIRIGLGGDSC